MTVQYHGVSLELPHGQVALSHSHAMDMMQRKSSTQNMDWTEALGNLPWGSVKDVCARAYEDASRLFSLMHLDYQVCNGGIGQYFYNFYDEARGPYSQHDVEQYGIDVQKDELWKLVCFGRELFPQRQEENEALARAATAFDRVSIERDAEVVETIDCEEDKYLWDEDAQEFVLNPDYAEPYEETTREDVIYGEVGFDETFYAASSYMEELLELRAQYHCKVLAREIEAVEREHPETAALLREHLPAAALEAVSLSSKIASAEIRAAAGKSEQTTVVQEPELKSE